MTCRQRGVSLIEVLVVLIILGLISSVAISGGSNVFLMQQKLQNAADKSFQDALVNQWFRSTFESAFPLPERPPVFTASRIQFTTQNPLVNNNKVADIAWSLTVDGRYVVLTYFEGETQFEVRRWFEAEASFEYAFAREQDALPEIVYLQVDYLSPSGRKLEKTLASNSGPKTFPQDYRRLE